MAIEQKAGEIRKFCEANADAARVKKYTRYFTEGWDAYGVEQKLMESQRARWLEEWKEELGFEGFLKLGDLLVQSGKYEEASNAIMFAAAFKEEFTAKTFQRVGKWLDSGFRNWAHTDVFCGEVLAHFLIRKIVPIEAMAEWRNAESKWKRRAVPVALIEALKAGFPVARLLAFIAPMMLDPERMVQQGLGWFLREAWKKSPGPTEKFLLRWKDSCGRVIVQYATEKMSASKKAKFKRSRG